MQPPHAKSFTLLHATSSSPLPVEGPSPSAVMVMPCEQVNCALLFAQPTNAQQDLMARCPMIASACIKQRTAAAGAAGVAAIPGGVGTSSPAAIPGAAGADMGLLGALGAVVGPGLLDVGILLGGSEGAMAVGYGFL